MNCDCKVISGEHDDYCNMHPSNLAQEEIELLKCKLDKTIKALNKIKSLPHTTLPKGFVVTYSWRAIAENVLRDIERME